MRHLISSHQWIYTSVVQRLLVKQGRAPLDIIRPLASTPFSIENWVNLLVRWMVTDDQVRFNTYHFYSYTNRFYTSPSVSLITHSFANGLFMDG